MNWEVILFWVFAVMTVLSSALVVTARNPINSAMSLVATFFFLAGIYVLLWAHTIAALQILVYAGAIMVLFLFVIMLLNLGEETAVRSPVTVGRIAGALAAVGLLLGLGLAITRFPSAGNAAAAAPATFGTLASLGHTIYTQWLFPFEAVSLLLLVAIVGAVVVAKSRI